MARYRRKKDGPVDIFELVLPLAGLLVLGLYFSPAFRQLLGALLYLLVAAGILALIGFIAWKLLRKNEADPGAVGPSAPVPSSTDQPPALRAANGHVNLVDDDKSRWIEHSWSQELLSKLEWKRFEEVVAAYSRELGYEAITARTGADGGVDVKLYKDNQAAPVMIIQCKAWDAYKVGVKPVRELFGVMAADKVANGAFFTTGEYTAEAVDWARDKNLDLVNGREFINRIGQLPEAAQEKLLSLATSGDYTTPTCPSCGVKMVLRTAGKGRSEGSSFYGCRNYPRCKQTFRLSQAD